MIGMVTMTNQNRANFGIDEQKNRENNNIVVYNLTSDFKYMIKMIVNSDAASTYQLSMNFPKFEGMELLPPE